jgi:lipopolysaccharide export system protein LptA
MPKHERRWNLKWQQAQVSGDESNLTSGNLTGVTGTIYGAKAETLLFSSEAGKADKQARLLTLNGQVQIKSQKQHETLTADEVDYDAQTKVLTAIGNVRLARRVGAIGTFSKLMATSDFKRVGTPDLFQPMKKAVAATSAITAAAVAIAQSVTFTSPDKGLTIRFGSFSLQTLPNNARKLIMTGGVDATSKTQGLRIKGDKANGIVATVKGKMLFQSMDAHGSVVITKSVKTTAGQRTTNVECSDATYQSGATEATIRGLGGVHIKDFDPLKKEVLDAQGSTCEATVLSAATGQDDPLKALTLDGAVKTHLLQSNPGGKPGTLDATSDKLTYETTGGKRTVTLRGHVNMDGNNGVFTGHLGETPVVVLTLDEQGRVESAYTGAGQ